jgi:multicomponent Na+:H+ antiporter subunit F
MTAVFVLTFTLLSVSALLTMVRLVRGPSVLDRIVALDVLVTLLITGVAVGIASRGEGSSVPLLLVLALLGFIGSVSAAHLVEEREDMR